MNKLPSPFLYAFLTALVFFAVISVTILFVNNILHYPVLTLAGIKNLALLKQTRTLSSNQLKKEVVAFIPSWTIAKDLQIPFDNISQIVYFGLGVNNKGEIIQFNEAGEPVWEWVNFNSDQFKKIQDAAKQKQKKVVLAIKLFDNLTIDTIITDPYVSGKFTRQIQNLILNYELDGINIDFEYVTDSNFPTNKFLNRFFANLANDLKGTNPDLILSADFTPGAIENDRAYDMVKIGEVLDQIIVMGYDYKTAQSNHAGPVAPLFSDSGKSIDSTVKSLSGRVPKEKIILAIPFYGYEWQTLNSSFEAPVVENTGALATYQRVKTLIISRNDIVEEWNDQSRSPRLFYYQNGGIKQIYFENQKSIEAKMDYILTNNLGGAGVWALGYEGNNPELWDAIKKYTR